MIKLIVSEISKKSITILVYMVYKNIVFFSNYVILYISISMEGDKYDIH